MKFSAFHLPETFTWVYLNKVCGMFANVYCYIYVATLSQEYDYASICHTITYYSSREVTGLSGVDGKFNRMTEWFGGYYFK